jgi:hypothetical protein
MEDARHENIKSSSKSVHRSTSSGKAASAEVALPFFFLIGGNLVFASLLLLMRGTGPFQIQQSFLPLLTIGGLLSCVSTGTLLLIRLLR